MKTILTLMLLPLYAQAQTFINLGTTDKGVLVGTGYKDRRGAVVSISYSSSLSSTEVPNTLMMMAGYEFTLSRKEEDNWTLTALIGNCDYTYSDAGKYLGFSDGTGTAYSLELAKDWHMGRLYLVGSYAGRSYVGGGMKVFFGR